MKLFYVHAREVMLVFVPLKRVSISRELGGAQQKTSVNFYFFFPPPTESERSASKNPGLKAYYYYYFPPVPQPQPGGSVSVRLHAAAQQVQLSLRSATARTNTSSSSEPSCRSLSFSGLCVEAAASRATYRAGSVAPYFGSVVRWRRASVRRKQQRRDSR